MGQCRFCRAGLLTRLSIADWRRLISVQKLASEGVFGRTGRQVGFPATPPLPFWILQANSPRANQDIPGPSDQDSALPPPASLAFGAALPFSTVPISPSSRAREAPWPIEAPSRASRLSLLNARWGPGPADATAAAVYAPSMACWCRSGVGVSLARSLFLPCRCSSSNCS